MQYTSSGSAQVIHETLGLKHYLFALASGRACRYCRLSPAASLARSAVRGIRCLAARDRTEEFGWGDTEILGKAVGEASRQAMAYLPRLESAWRVFENRNAYGFDMSLVVKKYLLVEALYRKYFSYELCMRFSIENSQTSITLIVDDEYAEPYIEKLAASGVAIVSRRRCVACEAIAALLIIAFIMPVYWRWRTTEQRGEVTGLVCNINDPKMLSGYEELFSGTGISPTYVVPREYARYFSRTELSSRVIFLGLTRSGYDELKETIWRMLRDIVVNFGAFSCLGPHTLKLVNRIIHARIGLPDGHGYSLLACEHHDLVKTIRNELIRKRRSTAVLFPYSSLYVLRYHADEFYENYDFVFSPGKHYDDTLEENEGRRCAVLPAGTYAIHKHGLSPDKTAVERRIDSLKEFVGDDRVVTILCPGVCKPTYHSEVRLMETARALANSDGIKVLVRQKPFVPEDCYAGFYEMHTRGSSSILVTGAEYELFDFLPITHLFVTSYSTSACELAACGANVLFVDFLRQDERFVFWQPDIVGTLLVDEAGALGRILALLRRDPDLWPQYEVDRARFADYIAYRCESYDAYRANVQRMLREIAAIPAATRATSTGMPTMEEVGVQPQQGVKASCALHG